MPLKELTREIMEAQRSMQKVELADAHCHLDLFISQRTVEESITKGVKTMVTDGVNLPTSQKALQLGDGKHVFPAVGIDPENALLIPASRFDSEIKAVEALARANRSRIVAIGEVGLDFTKATTASQKQVQMSVFESFISLADELKLPMSVHSRNSMDEVLDILGRRKGQKVQLHFFEGDAAQARRAEKQGYMISVPPTVSAKRVEAIKAVDISSILCESDAPTAGKVPFDVSASVAIVAKAKGVSIEKAAEAIVINTKQFFNTASSYALRL